MKGNNESVVLMKTTTRSYLLLVGAISYLINPVLAQQTASADSARVFSLGEVTVLGRRGIDSTNTVLSRQIEAFNRLDVGRALNVLPGVTLSK